MSYNSVTTVDEGGGRRISAVPADIIKTHILARLDGPSLAATACASSHLHALSAESRLWRDLCSQTWPSTAHPLLHPLISTFPAGHRSFYADCFPTLCHRHRSQTNGQRPLSTPELISAVDVFYQGKPIISKVRWFETVTGWFLSSPFRVDLLDPDETVRIRVNFLGQEESYGSNLEENLSLSWILIDPAIKRAANFSSLRPVRVNQHWLTGDIQVRYATILGGEGELVQCGMVMAVTCRGKEKGDHELELKEVKLELEDVEGRKLWGRESLGILQESLESGERRRVKRGERRERYEYEEYMKRKMEWKEREERRERRMDLVCVAVALFVFIVCASCVVLTS